VPACANNVRRSSSEVAYDKFTQAGPVVSVAVIKDRDTGTSKGFGFVEMTSQVDAQKAISMFNAYKMGERPLTVNMAKPREERSSNRGGGYRGF